MLASTAPSALRTWAEGREHEQGPDLPFNSGITFRTGYQQYRTS